MKRPPLLDMRQIRKTLGRTFKNYGWLLSIHCYGLTGKPIPCHRLLEWEKNSRPVPAGIYRACAETVADEWACRRHEASPACHTRLDEYYGSLISPALGSFFSSLLDDLTTHEEIKDAFIKHVQQTFGFDISYVWE